MFWASVEDPLQPKKPHEQYNCLQLIKLETYLQKIIKKIQAKILIKPGLIEQGRNLKLIK